MAQPKLQASRAGPGRPRSFDSDEVLLRALELFWRKGFANTTTRDLETELKLNQSSLYNSFGSKHTFFNTILDRYEVLTNEALLEPLHAAGDKIAHFQDFFSRLVDRNTYKGRRGCMLINMMAEDGGQNPEFARRAIAFRRHVQDTFERVLDRAVEQGDIEPGDNTARASILLGLTLGLNLAARANAASEELAQLTRAIHAQLDSWRSPK